MDRAGPLLALALLAALLAVQPAVEGVAPRIGDLRQDIVQGDFSPLKPPSQDDGGGAGDLADLAARLPASFTGQGGGTFASGPGSFPETWSMDRVGAAGSVTVQVRCDPGLGALKRVKAYDAVEGDYDLAVAEPGLEPARRGQQPVSSEDRRFRCEFPVHLRAHEPVPIPSPHPKAVVVEASADPSVDDLEILTDGADTHYARAGTDADVTLGITYSADRTYFDGVVPRQARLDDVPEDRRPDVPPAFRDRIQPVLQDMGLENTTRIRPLLRGMQDHLLAFEDGPIPGRDVYPDKYHAIALGGNGCCRHRAFAFAVTAQTLGIPTRVVANEAHAYAESWVPDRGWMQFNLGGCGTYQVDNPNDAEPFRPGGEDPQEEEPPESEPAMDRTSTTIRITEAPEDVDKGEPFRVAGRVTGPDGEAVPDAPIRLFLNATKDRPGHLAATGRTGPDGTFDVTARVPDEAPPRSYHLVAGARPTAHDGTPYAGSWSDPLLDVRADTRLEPEVPEAAGVGTTFTARARLVDEAGAPVPDAPVRLTVDGTDDGAHVTDDDGWVRFRVGFGTYGDHRLVFRHHGDDLRGPSTANATVEATRVGVEPPDEVVVPRGGTASLEGRVLVGGEPGSARLSVDLPPPLQPGEPPGADEDTRTTKSSFTVDPPELPLESRADGSWTLELGAPQDADLGDRRIRYRYDGSTIGATEATIKAPADLTFETPETLAPGERGNVTARLASERAPLSGELVDVAVAQGDRRLGRALETDAAGQATLAVPANWTETGTLNVEASFAGTPTETRAQATTTVPVQEPLWARLLDGPLPLAAGLLLAGLAAAGLAARRETLAAGAAGLYHRLRGRRRPHLDLHLAEAPDLPLVWGVDEPARLVVALGVPDDVDAGDRSVTLAVGDRTQALDLDADGTAAAAVQRSSPDEVPVHARFEGDLEGDLLPAEARATLRLVAYGPEMTRVYEDLRAWAAARGPDLPDPATPREVGAALHRAGVPRDLVADVVRPFEAVNYAGRDPNRSDYVRLVRAARRVRDALEEGHRG